MFRPCWMEAKKLSESQRWRTVFVPETMEVYKHVTTRSIVKDVFRSSFAKSNQCFFIFGFSRFWELFSKKIVLPIRAPPSHHLSAKLVCQLFLDFLDLPSLAVISQSPCHLLVSHFLAIALLDSPAVSQCLFVFGGKLESALFFIHPPDAIFHFSIAKQIQKELVQSDFFLTS